jgi:hypothetical protein
VTEPISVFISYSWDNEEHKEWVLRIAISLFVDFGIHAILDQWDTDLGDDLTLFMEKSVREASRVLIICTEEYVRKAEAGLARISHGAIIMADRQRMGRRAHPAIRLAHDYLLRVRTAWSGSTMYPLLLMFGFKAASSGGGA